MKNGIFFYHLGCHQWVSGTRLALQELQEVEALCSVMRLLRVTHTPTMMWKLWAEATRSCLELASGGVAAQSRLRPLLG